MSVFGRKFDEALDKHITGNYGEKQFLDNLDSCEKCGEVIYKNENHKCLDTKIKIKEYEEEKMKVEKCFF